MLKRNFDVNLIQLEDNLEITLRHEKMTVGTGHVSDKCRPELRSLSNGRPLSNPGQIANLKFVLFSLDPNFVTDISSIHYCHCYWDKQIRKLI